MRGNTRMSVWPGRKRSFVDNLFWEQQEWHTLEKTEDHIVNSASSTTETKYLTNNQVRCWGAAGGLAAYLAKYVVIEPLRLAEMVAGSEPVAQLSTICILAVVAALIGGLWAFAHRPLRTGIVALQLGVIAPAAFLAMAIPAAAATHTEAKTGSGSSLVLDAHTVPTIGGPSAPPTSPSGPSNSPGSTKPLAPSNPPSSDPPSQDPESDRPGPPVRPSIWKCIRDAIYNIPC